VEDSFTATEGIKVMGFRLGPIVGVALAVEQALNQAAASPNNGLKPAEVPIIVPKVTQAVTTVVQAQTKPVIDVLMNQEAFWKSPQWWVSMLGVVSVLLGAFGVVFDAGMQKEALEIIMATIGLITAVTLFWNRYIRKSALMRRLGWTQE
jgi:hypothetical protein